MNQLYEAMPIPLSDDAEDTLEGSGLEVSSHASGASSWSRSCTHSADAGSSTSSGAPGEMPEDDAEACGRDIYAAKRWHPERHGHHHNVFTTSSSPNNLFAFLAQLLDVAKGLYTRLERLQPSMAAAVAAPPPYSQTSRANEESRASHVNGKGTAKAAFQGIAKLRTRLCKEMANVQRAVEGLSAAGCTDVLTSSSPDPLAVPPAIFESAVACAQCNSISHYGGIVACLERERDVTGVYVPVSSYVGPPQCVHLASVKGMSTTHRPSFREDMRIEVDVVSNSGHRWIKVKATTARNLELEAAALDVNGATPFTDMLLALIECSKRTCLPHRRTPQVAVVLLHPPPLVLRKFFAEHSVFWAPLSEDCGVATPHHRMQAQLPHAAVTQSATTWFPPLTLSPAVICLDTTALVTLCSQSCYVDGLPYSVRMERLAPFRVLQEQQRKEVDECSAVVAALEPALRLHTAWYTSEALEQVMRQALLLQGDDAAAETTPSSAVKLHGQVFPTGLILPIKLDWLAPLEVAARERSCDAADGSTHQCITTTAATTTATPAVVPLDESSLLVECSDLIGRDAASVLSSLQRRPNWIMADVTYEEFKWILETIAGPQEVARAARLLRLVSVVDTTFLRDSMRSRGDCEGSNGAPSTTGRGTAASRSSSPPPSLFTFVEYLRLSGKVFLRNKFVFGLADAVNAIMVTSNEQMIHAAREQGVHIEACFHPCRSLTEQKMYGLQRRHGPESPPAVTL
ncbi:hypothetical protein LPMP_250360 [Leishmania panamensis]|uniref:DUF1308 domain-containing protein n=1 Tax=Leishmania panamensis TaxID=5679 RepID=A0A088SB68_LEIPA|nr:hypothetical protein LPMP_250360 [Leishmania panamensis]AIN98901.1 hypothetical protein LPMP_250360 [Leishmania panamensis]